VDRQADGRARDAHPFTPHTTPGRDGNRNAGKEPSSLKLQITINGKTYTAEVEVLEDDGSTRKSGSGPDQSDSAAPIPAIGAYTPASTLNRSDVNNKLYLSPLMGLVVKVNVKPGQRVEANDLIIVLEAMKMETSITAHHAGKVKSVSVAPGDSVKLNQVLVEFE